MLGMSACVLLTVAGAVCLLMDRHLKRRSIERMEHDRVQQIGEAIIAGAYHDTLAVMARIGECHTLEAVWAARTNHRHGERAQA